MGFSYRDERIRVCLMEHERSSQFRDGCLYSFMLIKSGWLLHTLGDDGFKRLEHVSGRDLGFGIKLHAELALVDALNVRFVLLEVL